MLIRCLDQLFSSAGNRFIFQEVPREDLKHIEGRSRRPGHEYQPPPKAERGDDAAIQARFSAVDEETDVLDNYPAQSYVSVEEVTALRKHFYGERGKANDAIHYIGHIRACAQAARGIADLYRKNFINPAIEPSVQMKIDSALRMVSLEYTEAEDPFEDASALLRLLQGGGLVLGPTPSGNPRDIVAKKFKDAVTKALNAMPTRVVMGQEVVIVKSMKDVKRFMSDLGDRLKEKGYSFQDESDPTQAKMGIMKGSETIAVIYSHSDDANVPYESHDYAMAIFAPNMSRLIGFGSQSTKDIPFDGMIQENIINLFP